MTHAMMKAAIAGAKAAIMTVREADNLVSNARPLHTTPRLGSPALRQQMFDWKARDKYQELCNFPLEVKNIFMTNNYETQESERVPIILNWLGGEWL